MNTTGMFAVRMFLRKCVKVSGPSICGIITSIKMTSGSQLAAVTKASAPLEQLINMMPGSSASDISTTSRMSGSSST